MGLLGASTSVSGQTIPTIFFSAWVPPFASSVDLGEAEGLEGIDELTELADVGEGLCMARPHLARISHRVSNADGESRRPAVLVANRAPRRSVTNWVPGT